MVCERLRARLARPGFANACQPPIQGVDCAVGNGCGEPHWKAWGPIPWQAFGQGEYVGPPRLAHVPEYRLRVDDQIEFVYRLKRDELPGPYLLEVGDEIQIESLIDEKLNRKVTVQPDGTIDLLLLGPVRVIRKTVDEIRDDLNEQYKKYYRITDINVTRIKTQTRANDSARSGQQPVLLRRARKARARDAGRDDFAAVDRRDSRSRADARRNPTRSAGAVPARSSTGWK